MELIEINPNLCTKCGLCTNVCPSSVLLFDSNGPRANNPQNCISCGQCVAVCPNSALDNIKTPLSKQTAIDSFPVIDSNTAETFLRSRRSIRCFKSTSIPNDNLIKLLNIARFAPTASNSQGLSYIIVSNKTILNKMSELVVQWMENQQNEASHWSFPRHINNYRNLGIDTILRDAPHLIIATAPDTFSNGRSNTISSLSYVELYSTSLGLGSCWAGLFEFCAFSKYEPLLNLLNIPKDKVITGAIMIGYPKYKYQKLVDRNPLNFTFIN